MRTPTATRRSIAFYGLIKGLQTDFPRPDHRATVEHLAYSTEQQSAQMGKLGMQASVNPYYHYLLSEAYAVNWLGPDRAAQMTRLGSLERHGVPLTLHSDAPMAPLSPLTLVWAASERQTISGAQGLQSRAAVACLSAEGGDRRRGRSDRQSAGDWFDSRGQTRRFCGASGRPDDRSRQTRCASIEVEATIFSGTGLPNPVTVDLISASHSTLSAQAHRSRQSFCYALIAPLKDQRG